MNKTQLRESAKITTNAMSKMTKDEPVTLETLEKICGVLECKIEEIVEIIPED
jgi:DNA (cytosine-5)-methyltransferase 1